MCTQTSSKVPSLNQFLVMTTAEILELPVNKCQPSELYKISIRLCVYGIAHQINHPVTIQILALKYFVNKFDYSSERVELYDVVVPKLKESLCELLQSSELDMISSLINSVTLTICDTVDSTCDDSSEALQSLAIGVLDLLLELYKLIFERTNSQRDGDGIVSELLQRIIGSVNVIRSKLLDHLKFNEARYLPDDFTHNDVMFVNRLVVLLCEMAEFAHRAEEASFLVAVWRCIVAVCVGKLPKSIERLTANGDDSYCLEFLLSVVKQGCFSIQYGCEEMTQSSAEQAGKFHNRTIVFVTFVFQRLATVYSHDKFRGNDHVLTTLLTMMRTLRTHSPPNAFLNRDLVSGLQNVLLLICKSDDFAECFHQAPSDEFSIELLRVGVQISAKLLNDADFDFSRYFMKSENRNIVAKMVECLAIDASTMFNDAHSMYHKTVETLSTILFKCSALTVTMNVVPRLLVTNLLQCNDILAGYIWLDLWTAWIQRLTEEQCYELILFWSEINEKYSAVQSIDLTAVHVRILLRKLFDSLSGSYKLKLSSGKALLSNIKLWAALGLQRRECEAIEITSLHTKIDRLLKTFVIERSNSTFYKLIEHLRLLQTISQWNSPPVPDYLTELWNLNFNHRPEKYEPLIIPLIRISTAYHRSLNNSQHLQILRKLSAITNSSSVTVSIQLETLHYLRHVAAIYFTVERQKEILQAIGQLFNRSFVNSDPIVRRAAFVAYASVISKTKHEDIHPDNITDNETVKRELFDFLNGQKNSKQNHRDQKIRFLQELSSCSIRHECSGASVPSSDDSLGDDGHSNEEIRMRELIDRMIGDTKELMALNGKFRLTEEFCKNIASIRQELSSLK